MHLDRNVRSLHRHFGPDRSSFQPIIQKVHRKDPTLYAYRKVQAAPPRPLRALVLAAPP